MSNKKVDVAIIDYGMGNVHSVLTAVKKVAPDSCKIALTKNADDILNASHVIFPGVGAIADCMAALKKHNLDKVLKQISNTTPILGVCIGMHALMSFSQENGGTDCLQLFSGQVKHFDSLACQIKVPHMGWNQVSYERDHPLWKDIPTASWFYFVHSYYVDSLPDHQIAGWCDYGKPFIAAATHNNLFAVQFHPEKSLTCGLQLYKNFLSWDGSTS